MPTSTQISNASILTQERALHLLEIVRASDVYALRAGYYAGLSDAVTALVDVADNGSDEAIKSRMLDANLTAFDDDIEDGTVGVKGGKQGVDYSQSRDRDEIVRRILGLLYDGVPSGGTAFFYGSMNLTNAPVW